MTQFPLLPLRDLVVFPGQVVPLFVGRDKSVSALEAAMAGDKDILLVAQLDQGCDQPERDDLYDIGTVAQVLQRLQRGIGRAVVHPCTKAGGGGLPAESVSTS